jgi:hypothetical protein
MFIEINPISRPKVKCLLKTYLALRELTRQLLDHLKTRLKNPKKTTAHVWELESQSGDSTENGAPSME